MEITEKELQIREIAHKILLFDRNILLVDLRFLDIALSRFEFVLYNGKLSVDGEHIFYDPYYVISRFKIQKERSVRDYLHMVFHCIFHHMFISSAINRKCWDLACDIAVEYAISELNINSLKLETDDKQKNIFEDLKSKVRYITAEKLYVYFMDKNISEDQIDEAEKYFYADSHDVWYYEDEQIKRILNKNKKRKNSDMDNAETDDSDYSEDGKDNKKAQNNNKSQSESCDSDSYESKDEKDSKKDKNNNQSQSENNDPDSENSEDGKDTVNDQNENQDQNNNQNQSENNDPDSENSEDGKDTVNDQNENQDQNKNQNQSENNDSDSETSEDEKDTVNDQNENQDQNNNQSPSENTYSYSQSSEDGKDLVNDQNENQDQNNNQSQLENSYSNSQNSENKNDTVSNQTENQSQKNGLESMNYASRERLLSYWKQISENIQVDLETFSKQHGDAAGGLVENLREVNREKYDYSEFLKKFAVMSEEMKINDDEFDYIYYTYGLELYKNVPLIEPLEYKDVKRIKEFAIAIDTSGSVRKKTVQKFIEKTYNILKTEDSFTSKVNIKIIQCDAAVQEVATITNQKEFDKYIKHMRIRGRGGTDFRPVFAYVDELIKNGEFTNLEGLLYFTDGWGSFPKKKPEYQTAFIFLDDNYNNPVVPPWAIKLVLTKEDIFKK